MVLLDEVEIMNPETLPNDTAQAVTAAAENENTAFRLILTVLNNMVQ
jgi:hypothetical protein